MTNTNLPKNQIYSILDQLRDIMIAVATGGPRIDKVNQEYKVLYYQLTNLLRSKGIENPIPYTDLWKWYGKWSSGDLPTYQSRREYIIGLIEPMINTITQKGIISEIEITDWTRADRALGEARTQLETASNEEQFQSIGLLCREVLISLSDAVFDPDKHPPLEDDDVQQPSSTDVKRRLERYLAAEVAGGKNYSARKYAKAALELANNLQHDRNANFRDALLCTEVTASVVNFVAIISGKRDPEPIAEIQSNSTPPPF